MKSLQLSRIRNKLRTLRSFRRREPIPGFGDRFSRAVIRNLKRNRRDSLLRSRIHRPLMRRKCRWPHLTCSELQSLVTLLRTWEVSARSGQVRTRLRRNGREAMSLYLRKCQPENLDDLKIWHEVWTEACRLQRIVKRRPLRHHPRAELEFLNRRHAA